MAEPKPVVTVDLPTTFVGLAKMLITMFGPQTFGAVLLFTVWLIIVDPILSRDTKDREEIRKILEEHRAMRGEMRELIGHLKVSAEILDSAILERSR